MCMDCNAACCVIRASLAVPANGRNPQNNRPMRIRILKNAKSRTLKTLRPAKVFEGPRESAPRNVKFGDLTAEPRGACIASKQLAGRTFHHAPHPHLAAASAASAAASDSTLFPAASAGAPSHATPPGRGRTLPPVSGSPRPWRTLPGQICAAAADLWVSPSPLDFVVFSDGVLR